MWNSSEKPFNWRQLLDSKLILAFVLGAVTAHVYTQWSRRKARSAMIQVQPAQSVQTIQVPVAVPVASQPVVAQPVQASTVSGMGGLDSAGFEDLGYLGALGTGESGPPSSYAAYSGPASPASDFEILEGI